jgi:c(7)-type cytochrome triheme protein
MRTRPNKLNGGSTLLRRAQLLLLISSCVLFAYGWKADPSATVSGPAAGPLGLNESGPQDYSRFLHTNPAHTRLPCLLCHRRDDNSPRIRFPGSRGHMPCAGCHTAEFAGNTSPMCTICHTATGLKSFPPLRSFSARFDHGRHQRVNCAVCHKSTNRGVALSIPSGGGAHATCFSCHSASAPASMSSCSVCHQPGRLTRTSESARSFKLGFSHARHTRGTAMSCAVCHSVKAGSARGRQVSTPAAQMHFAAPGSLSCGGCHNGTRAFGPNDFANCKRCHTGRTFRF